MIGQIIEKTQVCEKSASCYLSATGEVKHLSFCPIGRKQYREKFNAQRRQDRENHKRFMAEAEKNLSELEPTLLPTTGIKPLESFGKGKPRF